MKRRTLLAHLREHGCKLLPEGDTHSVSFNPAKKLTATIPRNTQISDRLAAKICKDLGIPEV